MLGPKRAGARVRGVDVEVVRYKPEQKCVLRYDITWAGGEREMVYAKVAEAGTRVSVTVVTSIPWALAASTWA